MRRVLPLLVLAACARDGRLGRPGDDGSSCSVEQVGSVAILRCGDGTPVRLEGGEAGRPGQNGGKGPTGDPGKAPAFPSTAVRLVDAPDCPGGAILQRGPDRNGDGALQDDEVDAQARFCPPPPACTRLEASLVLQNSWDLAELYEAGCTEVLDDVQLVIPELPDLSLLSNLHAVGGALVIAGTDVRGVEELAALREVGTLAFVNDALLESLAGLSGLTAAGEIDLEVLPALGDLRGLEGLTRTSDLIVAGTGITDLDALAGLSVGPISISLRGNARLARASLPATTGTIEALEIRDNAELTSLAGLRPGGITQALVISGNPRLPTCEALRLLDALVVKPPYVEITANDDQGVCP